MIKDFTGSDVWEIDKLRDSQAESEMFVNVLKLNHQALLNAPNNRIYTIRDDKNNTLYAIAGYIEIHEGTFETWMIVPFGAKDKAVLRTVIKDAKTFMKNLPKGRFQTYVVKDFKQAKSFLKFLKFEQEGIMKQYVAGKDCYRYAYIKE